MRPSADSPLVGQAVGRLLSWRATALLWGSGATSGVVCGSRRISVVFMLSSRVRGGFLGWAMLVRFLLCIFWGERRRYTHNGGIIFIILQTLNPGSTGLRFRAVLWDGSFISGCGCGAKTYFFDISTVEDVRLGSEVLFGKLHAPVPIAYRPELIEEIRGKKLKFGYYLSGLSFFPSPRLFCFSSLTSR